MRSYQNKKLFLFHICHLFSYNKEKVTPAVWDLVNQDGSQRVGWPRKSVLWGAFQFVSVSACWMMEIPRSKPDRATRKEPTAKLFSQDHYLSRKMNSSVAWRSQFLLYYHSKSAVAWLIHFLPLILRSDSPQRLFYCLDMLRLGLPLLFRRTLYLIPF